MELWSGGVYELKVILLKNKETPSLYHSITFSLLKFIVILGLHQSVAVP